MHIFYTSYEKKTVVVEKTLVLFFSYAYHESGHKIDWKHKAGEKKNWSKNVARAHRWGSNSQFRN